MSASNKRARFQSLMGEQQDELGSDQKHRVLDSIVGQQLESSKSTPDEKDGTISHTNINDVSNDPAIINSNNTDVTNSKYTDITVTNDADTSSSSTHSMADMSPTDTNQSAEVTADLLSPEEIQKLREAAVPTVPKLKYVDRHQRVTWYIENELAEEVNRLNKLGVNKSKIMNDALRIYFKLLSR
ncbi:hypothetical protein LLE49_26750 [Alicyclobacillus tolerans]|uniref:hypothetical protein n=1 Tax=Alicyclobacillus tolerans TaxID=90970 RepID=UPI001F2F2D57|nr:hypothetical protein [Alicyclobacillus tolerans]MCF8568326.1 hypothetical protein [Alicyclobacillus tolerans]